MLTQPELDDLVRLIGDEMLVRLGDASSKLSSSSACGSGMSLAQETAPVTRNGNNDHWSPPKEGIAGLIDHTLLRSDATELDIVALCQEARRHGFATVCVHPAWVARAVRELWGSKVKTAAVVGFPHGATVTLAKCIETEQVLKLGAVEIDIVMQIGALKTGNLDAVYSDLQPVTDLAHSAGAVVKAILEMGCLGEDQKIHGCVVAKLAGADFIANHKAPTFKDITLARHVLGTETGIKVAGGIRSFEDFRAMMAAGATRIGTSASVEILRQAAMMTKSSYQR